MSFKDRNCRISLLILLFCLLLVMISVIFHQFFLLYHLVQIYWVILALLLGIPRIHAGIKELREARQNGERIPWQQNRNIIQGIGFGLSPFIEVIIHPVSGYHPGNSGWLILDLIWTVCVSVFIITLLFIEIILTVGSIRYLLNHTNPYTQYLQSISTEDQSCEE